MDEEDALLLYCIVDVDVDLYVGPPTNGRRYLGEGGGGRRRRAYQTNGRRRLRGEDFLSSHRKWTDARAPPPRWMERGSRYVIEDSQHTLTF